MNASLNHSVGELFDQVVARVPQKTAITYEGRVIRFSEMQRAANAIAWHLLAGNIRSPAHVALLFDRRIAAMTAMMGAIKAGHAYVPLDDADPDERIRFILGDCEPAAMITDSDHMQQAGRLIPKECQLINLDALQLQSPSPPLPPVPLETPAYLIYTSGSTGQPKGVIQTHRNLLAFVGNYGKSMRLCEDDRLSMLFSLSFGAANMHIYAGLLNGATYCAYNIRRKGISSLADWLDAERITVVDTVPTVFRQLTSALDPSRRFNTVRAVDLGGESVFVSDTVLFRRHFSEECLFVNHLGATETGVIAHFVMDRGQPMDDGVLPVGRSPEGVEVKICRPDGTEAVVDEVGEIVVTSPTLSPGYWRRPELNAEVFSEDSTRPGWRVYRSGDLGKITPDQNLKFLGRKGTRVKIRGHSVDLTEVEAALRRCKSVRDAVVIATMKENHLETERLVAYVVASGITDQDPKKLRREIAAHLPRYMLPSAYIFLDSLPQTATGKVDRKALPSPTELAAGFKKDFQPPADDVEEQIASVFQTILKYSPVGREDDFFLMGGDSLSAMDLQICLVNLFGNHVPDFFEEPTVAGLANAIQQRASQPAQKLMPMLLPRKITGVLPILFLVHGRKGQAHIGTRFVELLKEDQSLYVFQARGVDGIQQPHETIRAMAMDYIAAMKTVQAQGPYFLGAMCAGGYVAIEMAHLLRESGEFVLPLLLIDPPAPPFTINRMVINIRGLEPELKGLQEQGKIEFDFNDVNRRKGALQVAMSFETALVKYQPQPYDGTVFLLSTTDRLSEKAWGNQTTLKTYFSGDVQCFNVGDKHEEVLDTQNEQFALHLKQCVRNALAGVPPKVTQKP